MTWKGVVFFIFASVSLNISARITNTQVYDQVLEAVKSTNPSKCEDLLQKHFFTQEKNESIWVLALQDTWKYTMQNFTRQELAMFEKNLMKLKSTWNDCTRKPLDREDCKTIVFELINIFKGDFGLSKALTIGEEFISLRMAFFALEMLVIKVMALRPFVETRRDGLEWYAKLHGVFEEAVKDVSRVEKKAVERVISNVQTTEVCEVKQYLWQEFQQPGCEVYYNDQPIDGMENRRRKKRDLVDNNDTDGIKTLSFQQENNQDLSDDDEFYRTFTPDFRKVEQIGSHTGDFATIMDAKFYDFNWRKPIKVGKKLVNLNKTPKSVVINELMHKGYNQREKYILKKKEETKLYVQTTYKKLKKSLKPLMKQLKKLFELSKS